MHNRSTTTPINAADILCGLYLLREEELMRQGLTGREVVVAQHILNGEGTSSIARRLHLSVPGVKYHVKNILAKTKRANREELCALIRTRVAQSERTWKSAIEIQRQAEGRIAAARKPSGKQG